jgi:hypothetical protein
MAALSNAERQRLFRERRRQEAALAGAPAAQDGAWVPGETEVTTGSPLQPSVSTSSDALPAPDPAAGEVAVWAAWSEEELRRIDHWRSCQPDQPSRTEALRRLALTALRVPAIR